MVDIFIWKWEIDFGNTLSSQIISNSIDADFWLIVRLIVDGRRCITVGKYPRRLENLKRFEGYLNFKFLAARLSSNAKMKPVMVMARAVSFR